MLDSDNIPDWYRAQLMNPKLGYPPNMTEEEMLEMWRNSCTFHAEHAYANAMGLLNLYNQVYSQRNARIPKVVAVQLSLTIKGTFENSINDLYPNWKILCP
jgi:hypothetical protein